MEQLDESTVNISGNKPPSSQNPSETPSSATNNEAEIVNRQGLPDFETIIVNHPGNPSIRPETQSSSPLNHQNLDPSSPSSPPPKIPGEDDVSNPKSTSGGRSPSNSSDDDFPINSIPDPGPAIQNPPVQVMEGAEEPVSPSAYRIPSHVFDRANTGKPEWSVASNESLFSIHMGNMSFSRELNWLNSEMNTPDDPLPPLSSDNNNGGNTDNYQSQDNKPNDPSTSNQSQANNLKDTSKSDQSQVNKPNDTSTGDQSRVNKFNDMSHHVGKFHGDYDETTEAKAVETMRQVIMENSDAYDLSCVSVASRMDGSNHNNVPGDLSRHSDCSTKSFAFNLRADGEKSQRSPKGFAEKPKQKTQTETGTPRESSKATSRATKPCSNAPYKWLCCFTCCIK